MSPTLANFLFELANFLLLAAILGRILFVPVRRALAAEQERHGRVEEESRRLQEEAASAAEEARALRRDAEREAEERRREVIAAARRQADDLVASARAARREERRAFDSELEATRQAQAAEVAGTVGRIAAESVRRLLEDLEGPSIDLALVRAACARLETPEEVRGPVVVEAARRLEPQARELLAARLGTDFEERIVAELGAGVRVTTSGGQVDATAVSLARRAAASLRDAVGEEATDG